MKRNSYLNSSKFFILFGAMLFTIASLFAQPNLAAAAQVTSSCTDEITLVFSGLNPSQAVDVDLSYSTGQTDTISETANSSGDLTLTLDRTSNTAYSVVAQVELSDSIISTSVSCPTLNGESGTNNGGSNAFVCEPAFYQVLGSSLNRLDPTTFEYSLLGTHNRGYNGIGYNVEDNFIYGIEKSNGKYSLKKINSKGVHTDLGLVDIASGTNYRGDFDLSGNLVVTNGKALYSIDVSATPPTVDVKSLTKVGSPSFNFHDITFNPVTKSFWTFTKGQVIEIDPTALTIEAIADYSDIADGAPYGAAFSDTNGDLYFSKNKTGVIYFADLNATGSVLDFYPIADGGANSNNDGASCPNAAPPFEMSCGDGIDNDQDGLMDANDPDCADTDSDGVVDLRDQDDDNDGIPDIVEDATAVNNGDSDNDGIPDSKDLDSDDDGLNDIAEAGHGEADGNNDGRVDGPVGENGLADSVETSAESGVINYTVTNSDPSTPPNFQVVLDSDSDGVPDVADLDDDNDGIPDAQECFLNTNSLPIAIVNGSFEDPDIDFSSSIINEQWGSVPNAAATFAQTDVHGWFTTATDGRIEIWQAGHGGFHSFNGEQHAEINAYGFGALYQDISTTPGTTMIWSFAHRGRGGPDTIQLNIGPANGTMVTVQTMTTDRHDWVVYTGEYVVPGGQTETRFEYQAVSTAYNNISVGNFLDNIQFYVQSESLNCNLDTDSDGIIDSLDLDSDGDGLSDAYESGHNNLETDSDGRLTGEAGDNGLVDSVESEPDSGVIGYSLRDTDEDGKPNFQQFDDIDGDGVEINDLDFDNDGIPNHVECASLPCTDDQDGDGIPNAFDLDSDNDGINDLYEIRTPSTYAEDWLKWLDPDQNGVLDGPVGANGYNNAIETNDGQTATYNAEIGAKPQDDDNDSVLNFLDLDSDGNNKFDIFEAGLHKLDEDNDGQIDDMTDHDFDGIPTISDGTPKLFGDSVPTGLTVELYSDRATVSATDLIELTMLINNVGGSDASDIDVMATLPANLSASTLSWNIPSIAAGSTHTITWSATAVSTQPNQSYEINVKATGLSNDGSAIPTDNSMLIPNDIDPDDSATTAVMGLGDTVCETQIKNVAFEDLKNEGWSDWDYNDLIVKLETEMCFTPNVTQKSASADIWYDSLVADASNSCANIEFEAESGNMVGFETVSDSSASGGSYVHVPNIGIYDFPVSKSRMITYSVNIPATGTYEIFGDVQGLNGKSDSFYFQIDDSDPIPWHIKPSQSFYPFYVADFVNGWHNLSLELDAGEHIITIYNREDGSRLDKLTIDCIEAEETPAAVLASTTITYTLLARGAGFDHALMHNLPFAEGGQYSLTKFDGDGVELSSENGLFDESQPIEIFSSSKVGLPPFDSGDEYNTQTNTRGDQEQMINGHSAVLTFSINSPEKYQQDDLDGFPWDLYLPVHDTDQEIHLQIPGHMGNSQLVNAEFDANSPMVGYNMPFGFVFEEEWTWPLEFEGIWKAYPNFVEFMGTGFSQNQNWYTADNAFGPFLWNNRNNGRQPLLPMTSEEIVSRYFASPVVADIDDDGIPEVIIGDLIGSKVSVFDLNQNLLWSVNTDGGIRAEVVVKDIDFDGDVELVVGDESGKLYAWHHDGAPVTNFPITVSSARLLSSPVIEDINDDAELDIVQVSSDGTMYIFNIDGTLLWQAVLDSTADGFGAQERNGKAVVEDLDGDGSLEIVVPSASGAVSAFDSDGQLVWTYGADDSVISTPIVANFDPDQPGYEVIFGSGDSYIYVLDQDGQLIWKQATDWIISSDLLLHDLDSDGFPEILVGGEDQKLHAFHFWAETVAGWPRETYGAISSAPVAGDIDADGEDEIMIGGEDGKLYAWNSDGSPVPSWPKQTGESYKGAPVILNADDDAEEEIFAADFSGALLTWGIEEDDPIVVYRAYLPSVQR